MSFWSVPSKSRRRAPSPESDMFFDTATNFARSNLADRLGSSVFDDFPTRRSAATMRNFPSHTDQMPFGAAAGGSLHRTHPRHHAPSWLSSEDFADSRESSPLSDAARTAAARHPVFQRADSNPSRATPPASRQDSQHGSRSSTPESTGSGHSHRSRASATSTGTDEGCGGGHPAAGDESMEEHPGVTARNGRQSFTARRQPKVHHIPIHVEPRDGSSTPVVLTPPVDGATEFGGVHQQQQQHHHQHNQRTPSESPPVTRCSSQTGPESSIDRNSSSGSLSGATAAGAPTVIPVQHQQAKTVPSPPPPSANAAANKKPPFRAKTKASASGGVQRTPVATKPVVPEPVFPTANPPEPELPKPAKPGRKSPLEAVNDVLEDVAKLREVVAQFDGAKGDKRFLYLDEMLTRNLIKLDNIETDGNEEVRQARRGAVLAINDCLGLLDSRASLTAANTTTAATEKRDSPPEAVSDQPEVTDDACTAATPADQNQPVDDQTNANMDVECTISFSGEQSEVNAPVDADQDSKPIEATPTEATPMEADDGSSAHTDPMERPIGDNGQPLDSSTTSEAPPPPSEEPVEVAGN